jgi:hypothetical protein
MAQNSNFYSSAFLYYGIITLYLAVTLTQGLKDAIWSHYRSATAPALSCALTLKSRVSGSSSAKNDFPIIVLGWEGEAT